MGNSTSKHKTIPNNAAEERNVGIASHPYQKQHPYHLDNDDNEEDGSIYTENYEDYVDELLEPRQLKNMFSGEEKSTNSIKRSCRQKQTSRRAGEVFEPMMKNCSRRISSNMRSSQNHYDSLEGHGEEQEEHHHHHHHHHLNGNPAPSFVGKKANKNTSILKALQQKLTAPPSSTDTGNRHILTKASTDSEDSNGSSLSFREFVKLSAKSDDSLQSQSFHTYGKQLSTILDMSEYSNTNFNDSTILSDASSENIIDQNMTDYTDRMNSFLDKNHASFNQGVERIPDVKTPNEKLGDLFADMTLDQSSRYIVMDDIHSDREHEVNHDHNEESTNGTWDEIDDSSSKYFIGNRHNNNDQCVQQNVDESAHASVQEENDSCDEELSSIDTTAFDSKSVSISEVTSLNFETKDTCEERSECTPYNECSTNHERRDPSPVPITRPMKAPTTSNLVNLLPSMSNDDEESETLPARKIVNDKKHVVSPSSFLSKGSKIGTYIDFDDDMTQVSAITTAPVLNACAVIQNHSKPALSKQAISNAMFLFSEESVPSQKKNIQPSTIDEQRLSLLNLDLMNQEDSKITSFQHRSQYGELTLPNEAPVDMVRRLSRESFGGRVENTTHKYTVRSQSVTIQKNSGYIQINNQGSIFSIPEENTYVGGLHVPDIVPDSNGNSSNIINSLNDDETAQSNRMEKENPSLKTVDELDNMSCHDSLAEILDDDFQHRYSAITPMKTKSPYVRFKKALRMFGGTVGRNDLSNKINQKTNMMNDSASMMNEHKNVKNDQEDNMMTGDDCSYDTRSLINSNAEEHQASHSPELSSKSSDISSTASSANDVFADLLNSSSPESSYSQMYLPVQLQSAMKKPNQTKDHSINRVSWVIDTDNSNASDIFRTKESSVSSVADSASAISMTPPPPFASSSRTFRSVVNPRMMNQSSQAQSKVNIHENDENSLGSSYCSYSPLKSQNMSKSIEKAVPNSRSALCLSPLQKTPSQSRKWRKSVGNDERKELGNGGSKRQRSATKRTPFANLRNANFV